MEKFNSYSLYVGPYDKLVMMPVLPETISILSPSFNKTVNLLSVGEVNVLKSPNLKTFCVEFKLPRNPAYSFVEPLEEFKKPSYYIELFHQFQKSKEHIVFLLLRYFNGEYFFDTRMKVSVEDFTVTEKGGDVGSFTLKVNFKEFKNHTLKKEKLKVLIDNKGNYLTNSKGEFLAILEVDREYKKQVQSFYKVGENFKTDENINVYTVVKGDNLWDICKRFLNDGSRYKEIALLNNIKNPSLIYPNTVLKLPAK